MTFRKMIAILYPFLIGFLLPVLLFSFAWNKHARAGTIRKAELSQDRPLIVKIAPGRTTAISFAVRPEKVVPGNPSAIEINFLNRDITLRPIASNPGNLIVYTKSARYVILLGLSTDGQYDDVVSVSTVSTRTKPIRLTEDAFIIGTLKLTFSDTDEERSVAASIRHNGMTLESQEIPHPIQCTGCVVKKVDDLVQVACRKKVDSLDCKTMGRQVKLQKVKP